jgi:hypothetical protein
MRFVLGEQGSLVDLSREGGLASKLQELSSHQTTYETATQRRDSVRNRFSWPVLSLQYRDMFFDCVRAISSEMLL